jgi:biopolymer transport protein ExbD
MPIYAPGIRSKSRVHRPRGRNIVALLSLTAMVDMFTVLAVFLLQNYNTTGEVIELSDEVKLPIARAVKELRPAHIVVISKSNITLDKAFVTDFNSVKEQQDWKIARLEAKVVQRFAEAQEHRAAEVAKRTMGAVNIRPDFPIDTNPENARRVTVQADKEIDFLTIKKVMYTLYEAGASEINFAVMKEERTTK